MNDFSIDIESLGTNVESQILSVGVCQFDRGNGGILKTFSKRILIDEDKTINCTLGAVGFWINQAKENPDAVNNTFNTTEGVTIEDCLKGLSEFIGDDKCCVWALGTKFDLGILENAYKELDIEIPWGYNSDRCMRTLRDLCGRLEVDMGDYELTPHDSLSDAIFQAKYISLALSKLKV